MAGGESGYQSSGEAVQTVIFTHKQTMKLKITLKDPDGVYEAIRIAAKDSLSEIEGLDESEREELLEARHQKLSEQCADWIEFGEYVTIEIDTDAKTASVCEL
jgi:hypothetical protein